MKNKLKHSLFLLFLLPATLVISQDMHFTQFYASSLYLNPAFTGANVCSRVSFTYRNQWPGISKSYQSYLGSFDHYISRNNIGVGLLFGSDVAGTGGLRTTMINPLFSYEIVLSRKYSLRFGVQPGFTIKSINTNSLIYGDQLARGGNVPTVEAPVQSKAFFDFGAGALFYSSKSWIGASFYHLNKPNESLMGVSSTVLPIKYSVHGGFKYNLNEDQKIDYQKKAVTAAFNYRGQGNFDQFDIGVYLTQSMFNIGIWYRGIPGLKAYKPGYSNNDAVALIIGLETSRMNIGYSYDITVSDLASVSQGAHEITVSYQLCKLKQKKTRLRVVSCPKF